MSDSYNSDFTGQELDQAISKIINRGVTTKESTTTLNANTIIIGDAGGKNIKSSNYTVNDLEAAIARSGEFNANGVTAAEGAISNSKVVVGGTNNTIKTVDVSHSELTKTVSYASKFNRSGIVNGPKADAIAGEQDPSSVDLVPNNLVAYGASNSNKIIDAGISMSSLSEMTIGVPQIRNTGTGYLLLNEIPGLTSDSKISITAAMQSQGSASSFGTAVLYPGRNLYDVGHVRQVLQMGNQLGQRDYVYSVQNDYTNLLYAPASSLVQDRGFTSFASASSYNNNAYTFNAYYNHEYLIIAQWNIDERTSDLPHFNPSHIAMYNGANMLASSSITMTTMDGQIIDPEQTSVSGDVLVYAYLKPVFSYNGDNDVRTAWVCIQDSTARIGDSLISMAVVDITLFGDDALNITESGSTERLFSYYGLFNKYKAQYSSLVGGVNISDVKYHGPYYSSMEYFRPYYRNLFISVPAGLRLFIKEHRTSSGLSPRGYIKTISIGANQSLAIALDQQVELGTACLEFMISNAGGSAVPTTGTSSGQLAPNDNEASSICAPLVQYIPAEYVGKAINTSGPLFTWVRHYPAINMANGLLMTTNDITADDYNGGNGGWASTAFDTKIYDLSNVAAEFDDGYISGTISFQTYPFNTAKFNMGLVSTDLEHTRITYPLDSVSETILQLDQKINNINNKSLISTTPTSVGSYIYKVDTEGVPGQWVEESALYRHHFDVVINHSQLVDIPDGSTVFIHVNAVSNDKTAWETLSELDGKGYILSAFGTIEYPAPVASYVFELKLFISNMLDGTLLLNIHDLTDTSVRAMIVSGFNDFEIQDSVSRL